MARDSAKRLMRSLTATGGMLITGAAIVAAGAVQPTTVSVLGDPGNGNGGGCSTSCAVGANGNGGANGSAQGGLLRSPSTRYPGETVTVSGPDNSGHVAVTNEGALSGHIHPDGTLTGHESGALGSCSGHCSPG
jgi:hypothetical protein